MKILVFVILLVLSGVRCYTVIEKTQESIIDISEWWKNTVFYQIYPRSFKDSNGDGVGDIQGIIEKLDHLKDAGVGAAWISSLFKSPMKDFGYDISDFREVDPLFGTNADLKELFEKAHSLGIKIVLDFIPNHTSDQHEWFQKSVKKEGKYANYYVWHEGKPDPEHPDGRNLPPNNWKSVYSGSAWTYNADRKEYYLRQFTPEQPDLNYRSPDVVQEMSEILRFWLEQGADGFRIDSVNHLFEDAAFPDEPPTENYVGNPNSHASLQHIYTMDLPDSYAIVLKWREIVDDFVASSDNFNRKIIMTEAYTTFENSLNWYGTTEANPLSHVPFNFDLITELGQDSSAADFKKIIDNRLMNIPKWAEANWLLGNHDRSRVASRYLNNQIDALNMLVLTLPGIAVTYYGEEIGMEDYEDISWEYTEDPQACQTEDPENYRTVSRDPIRTPFQWDDSTSAGFSSSIRTWLPVSGDYKQNNLMNQKAATKSHYKLYKQLVELRNNEEFQNGGYTSVVVNNVLIYTRKVAANEGYGIAISFSNRASTIDLSTMKIFPKNGLSGTVAATSTHSLKSVGSTLDPTNLRLDAYESILIRYTSEDIVVPPVVESDPEWWKHAVYYQIYPRSFKDSDGDGIGDIQGIIDKLDHLKDAGIGATWLSPIFKSPMVDFGYDIQDFYEIDPIFGTMEDLKRLFVKAHELGIKIILDFVPNHTSDQHEWFQKSIKRDGKYADYYVWHDGKPDPATSGGRNLPPNNWISVFSGPAWTFNEERGQYYLRQFTPEQPDLNFRNPAVVQEMADVFQFWLEQGADGFRIDAINHAFEDPDFRDEPAVDGYDGDLNRHASLQHIYTVDLPEIYDMVRNWKLLTEKFVADHPDHTTKVIMTEAYIDFETTMKWYGSSEDLSISHIPFNFELISNLGADSRAEDFKEKIDKRIFEKPEWGVANWVQGNHDRNRVASRYSPQQIDALNTLVMTLPGIAVTYYGEEIGMEDNQDITWDETQDPQACQTKDPEGYKEVSRDPVRTPFQWDDTTSAGFSENITTWLPVHTNYRSLNLKTQKESELSHFKYYQSLIKLRADDIFRFGDFESGVENNVLYYSRTIENRICAIAVSFDSDAQMIDLSKLESTSQLTNIQAEVVMGTNVLAHPIGTKYNTAEFTLEPFEAVVFELASSAARVAGSFLLLGFLFLRSLCFDLIL